MSHFARGGVLALGCLSALLVGYLATFSLSPRVIYGKDFVSPYLMARAIASGENPYTPLPDLTIKYLPEAPPSHYPHPTPHTPFMGILCTPLALLSYRNAAILWLVLQGVCLILSALLIRGVVAPTSPTPIALAVGLLCAATGPVVEELWLGQFSLLLLPLLCGAWNDLRAGREARGGLWLGLLLALKLMAWPIATFLALRKRWRAVASAVGVAIAANVLAGAVIGFGNVRNYYARVGPQVSAIYRVRGENFSAYALGRRLFEGVRPGFSGGVEAAPLWPSPELAALGGILAPLAVLVIGLCLARRAKDFDSSFGLLVCVSVLIGPTAWRPYLILAAIPISVAMLRLRGFKCRPWPSVCLGVAISLMAMPSFLVLDVAERLGVRSGDIITAAPLTAFIITALPAFALLALAWLLWRTDGAGKGGLI